MTKSGLEVLWENKWIQVVEKDDWYTFVRNKGTNKGVCVLLFNQDNQVIIRKELTPPHGDSLRETSLTGTVELGESPRQTAVKEVLEESGFKIEQSDLIELGWIYSSKSSNTQIFLFAADITGFKQGKILGDGSRGEEGASAEWRPAEKALALNDGLVSAIIARLIPLGINLLAPRESDKDPSDYQQAYQKYIQARDYFWETRDLEFKQVQKKALLNNLKRTRKSLRRILKQRR